MASFIAHARAAHQLWSDLFLAAGSRLAVLCLLVLGGSAYALVPTYMQYDLTGADWAKPSVHYGPADATTVCTRFAEGGTEWLHAQGHPEWSYTFDHVNLGANGCFVRRSDGGMTAATMTMLGQACPESATHGVLRLDEGAIDVGNLSKRLCSASCTPPPVGAQDSWPALTLCCSQS
jgi:hypothetical protein